MTRKDYALIARIISDQFGPMQGAKIAEKFARELYKANPTFNIAKFVIACKVDTTDREAITLRSNDLLTYGDRVDQLKANQLKGGNT